MVVQRVPFRRPIAVHAYEKFMWEPWRYFANTLAGGPAEITARFLSVTLLQLLLGAPFLLHHPVAYVSRSFELGRVFKFEWTVNFKFLSETAFVSPVLSMALLALTVATLSLFASKWVRSARAVKAFSSGSGDGTAFVGAGGVGGAAVQLHPEYVVKTLFVSNFIGIVFCRSLHYQVKETSRITMRGGGGRGDIPFSSSNGLGRVCKT